MIYTITFNPSIDYIVQVKDFQIGKVNRIDRDYKYPGGKGINVARVLNNLNIKSKALGFIGGFTGEYIKEFLEDEGVETDFIKVEGDTRINVKLKSNYETEINGAGPNILENDLNKIFEKIDGLSNEDFLVLAGNVQSNLPRYIYSKIQERCLDNKVKVIVDTTGEALMSTLKHKPFLIKPNTHEIGEIFGTQVKGEDEIIYYANKLMEIGAQNIIVSMAGAGAILLCEEGIYHALPPKGTVKNSVGAGDSLVAGFLARYSKDSNILEAFRFGIASGSATAFSNDLCKKYDVDKLLQKVKITKLR